MTPIRISEDALQDLNEGFVFYEAQEGGVGCLHQFRQGSTVAL